VPTLVTRLPRFPWDALEPYKVRALAHPGGIVDLSVGTPVDPVPDVAREALVAACNAPGYPATAGTIQACAGAISALAEQGLMAMVEPFISHRLEGRVRNDLSPNAVIRSIAVAAGLGTTSAYTWLKLPVVEDMERVLAASTLPALLLGGEVSADQDAAFGRWSKALKMPSVRGLVVGRALLFPPDDNVADAVDAAVGLMRE